MYACVFVYLNDHYVPPDIYVKRVVFLLNFWVSCRNRYVSSNVPLISTALMIEQMCNAAGSGMWIRENTPF